MLRPSLPGWLVVAVSGAAVLAACSEKPTPSNNAPVPSASSAASTSASPLQAADLIVIETDDATFWQGTVVKVVDETVTYAFGSNNSLSEAPIDKVYRIDESALTTSVRAHDYAICRTGPTVWNPCQVVSVQGSQLQAHDLYGKTHELKAADVLTPRADTLKRIEALAKTHAEHRSFIEQARATGSPKRPEGWDPKPGEDVVALFGETSWVGGRIRKVTPTLIQVAWDDKRPASSRKYDEVVPQPASAQQVEPGQYVLVRPKKGAEWTYHRVHSVDGRRITVTDQEGKQRQVTSRDVILLGS